MKGLIIVILTVIGIIILSACTEKGGEEGILAEPSRLSDNLPNNYSSQEVSFVISTNSEPVKAPARDLFLEITNTGAQPIEYEPGVFYEKMVDGNWHRVLDDNNSVYADILYVIPSGETDKLNLPLENFEHRFSEGTYRIIKTFEVSDKEKVTLSVQFIVEG
ncbi:immunoglobulin-like domain-containing protein [Planococcus lenghuensis]|uniref:Bacterial Ig-like domain-containing protein n=1 Tax=Planococcus lenghuensis TaxID=2213202 RepID=A0A1Q2KZ93_9BACL|nr:immunoglobulin-like domain-containing protein [Planococcus lenghuensis]AQQ53444.1 hypothetical protein B0X71_10400 [Planococcus lenghuensis]